MFDQADHPSLDQLPHAQPAHDESVIVIAVFVISLLLLPGDVAVALGQVFHPDHPAPHVNVEAFDQLFCIVPPDIVSVHATNTLNQAGLYVAPAEIVRLL